MNYKKKFESVAKQRFQIFSCFGFERKALYHYGVRSQSQGQISDVTGTYQKKLDDEFIELVAHKSPSRLN